MQLFRLGGGGGAGGGGGVITPDIDTKMNFSHLFAEAYRNDDDSFVPPEHYYYD